MKNIYTTILFFAFYNLGISQTGPKVETSGACFGYDLEINAVTYARQSPEYCWDANANGIGDPSEDLNGDGVYNTLDCPAGYKCWDTNGNGVPDGDEDTNGDGIFNFDDCLNCWDYNFNLINDPEEDLNGDGFFNSDDCDPNIFNSPCNHLPTNDVTIAASNLLEISDNIFAQNGLNGLDLVNIRKWLVQGFPGALETIASDFDGDGTVSTSDVRDLQRYILGINSFPQYQKFKAVPESFVFPSVDPFNIDVDYSSLTFSDTDVTNDVLNIFVFMTGDSDQSALFKDDQLEGRSKTALSFEDITMEAGKSYTVQFDLSDDRGILGSCFRLQAEALQFESFSSQEDIMYYNENHQIGFSYVEYESQDNISFELTITATEDAVLSELISLDESFLKETVDADLNTKTLSLNPMLSNTDFINNNDELRFFPNPVDQVLTIEFSSSKEREITVSNISGQQLMTYNCSAERIDIQKTDSMQPGMYLLTVRSLEGTNTYKLFYK